MSKRPVKVYLCGPIANRSDDEAITWRNECSRLLPFCVLLDPMQRDYRDCVTGNERELVHLDKMAIRACDVLLYNCWDVSFGSAMELFYAHSIGKVTITVTDKYAENPWLIAHSLAMCDVMKKVPTIIRRMFPGGAVDL